MYYDNKPMFPHQSTIYTSPMTHFHGNSLQVNNYLSEYRTEIDKARVRANLGIPDEYSLSWGNIQGTIESQRDLIALIESYALTGNREEINKLKKELQDLDAKKIELSDLDEINTSLSELVGIKLQISELSKKVTSNSNAIKFILENLDKEPSDTPSDEPSGSMVSLVLELQQSVNNLDSKLNEQLSLLENKITNLEATDAQLNSNIQECNNKINAIQPFDPSYLQSQINDIYDRLNNQPVKTLVDITVVINNECKVGDNISYTVYAVYSDNTSELINNGIEITISDLSKAGLNPDNSITAIGPGNVTIQFKYGEIYKAFNIIITEEHQVEDQTYQYVGYAKYYTTVLGNPKFQTTTIKGTWTSDNTPVEDTPPFPFWICTTENVESIYAGDDYNVNDCLIKEVTLEDKTYKIYYGGVVRNTDTEYIINRDK